MKKLKEEFAGLVITRNWVGIGKITFDSNVVDQDKFENFAKYGFDDLFEDVEDFEEENEIEEEEKTIEEQVEEYVSADKPKRKRK